MAAEDQVRNDETIETSEDGMKVPIEDATPDVPSERELTEEEMIEAAIAAGDRAADEDMAAAAAAAEQSQAQAQAQAKAESNELYERLEEATAQVDAARKEARDAIDRLARLQADWENFRRRTRQEREVERERAAEKLVVGLLPVLDDMERAVDHARQNEGSDEQFAQFVGGVQQIHDKMVTILAKDGVEVIDPAGEPFDPLAHQAVGREENAEAYDETVAQVYQRGYRMGGKVIRNAMVTVTYGGPKRPAEDAEAASE